MKLRVLLSVATIVLSSIVVNTTWHYSLEQHERSQARNRLEKVRMCVVDYKGSGDLIDKLEFCAGGVKTTPTGDIFAYSLKTKKFLYDPSLDCHLKGGKLMTADSECSLHEDPEKCIKAIAKMNKGIESYNGLGTSWNFDDAEEFLEWIIFPDEDHSLDGKIVNNNLSASDQIVIAIGIQADELYQEFFVYEVVLKVLSFIWIVIVLLCGVYHRGFNDRVNP